MTFDIRWGLLLAASLGVILNAVMVVRLNRDVRAAREEALLDADQSLALMSRRRQSVGLLVILVALAMSSFFEAGSGLARLLVFIAVLTADWKSVRLFADRMKADVMVAERLRRKQQRDRNGA